LSVDASMKRNATLTY